MANHKSSIKRIRSNAAKRLRNRYQAKTTRSAISMIDRLAKKNIIHKNKASNNKSKLTKLVNGLK
jgi:small subunit ribosomal protein S20